MLPPKTEIERQKSGYLAEDFRIFYLTSTEKRDFQSHYHDFHKLLYFEYGSVSYYIEGATYHLQPGDIVLVPAGEVHRPVIHGAQPYRRLILYLSPSFFEQYKGADLGHCFSLCADRRAHVIRLTNFRKTRLYPLLRELLCTVQADLSGEVSFSVEAASLYQSCILLQFLLLLNTLAEGTGSFFPAASRANPQISQILSYLNGHLYEDLCIDQIADACYLSRSYLMHLFRKETGYTLGMYLTEKRLFAARTMIQSGVPVTQACMQSGFSSYAAFYRAYRKKFGEAPKASPKSSTPVTIFAQNPLISAEDSTAEDLP